MVRNVPLSTPVDPTDGYVIRRPRDQDALGFSLRHIFGVQSGQDDFADLLLMLDRGSRPN